MGCGSYTAGDWSKLRKSRNITKDTTEQIFTATNLKPKYNPFYVDKRESRDSDDHPNSTPIVIGVDVTGSMGYLSTQIIKESLNELMMQLYSTNVVADPQLLFAAIGDVVDKAPLQVTQFESDIRIAEQLLDLWLEKAGGDLPEDYELLWYFCARHTDTDAWRKRGKKGFCFTIGDAPCHHELKSADIKRVFNTVTGDISSATCATEASKTYELFHIMIQRPNAAIPTITFQSMIPGRVLTIGREEIQYLPEVIISTMLMTNGMPKEDVLGRLNPQAKEIVERAMADIILPKNGVISF